MRTLVALIFCLVTPVAPLQAAEPVAVSPAELEFFETKIRPVLVEHCYSCHSAEAAKQGKLKAGLQLDTRAGLFAGGESGPAIVVGKPGKSLLIQALHYDGYEMPPEGRLPDDVIANFERWVRTGAADPRVGQVATVKRGLTVEEGRKFWSQQPIRRHALPQVRDEEWSSEPIDRFILARQESAGIRPVRDADPRVLVRRIYLDLLGLPLNMDGSEGPRAQATRAFARNFAARTALPMVQPTASLARPGPRKNRSPASRRPWAVPQIA